MRSEFQSDCKNLPLKKAGVALKLSRKLITAKLVGHIKKLGV